MTRIEDIVVEPPLDDRVVDPLAWFDTPGPFELEIGCGKGGFLLARARAYPERRLLGIEWANKYFRYCADRMARWNLTNVRVMRTDAKFFVLNHLPDECVTVLHLYHPDPWPKARHEKRRIVQPPFVDAVVRVLVPGGQWRVQTDHEQYFEVIRELLPQHPRLSVVPWEDDAEMNEQGWTGTNFQVKYERDGRAIYRLAVVKG